MSTEEFAQEMAEHDAAAAEVPERKTLPDGWTGQARVAIARVERASWEPNPLQLFYVFEALDDSGSVAQWDSWDTDTKLEITVGRLKRLGYPCNEEQPFSRVAQACADGFFENLIVEGRVKYTEKRDHPGTYFVNFYVNKVIGKLADGAALPQTVTQNDDDLPF